MAFCPLFAFYAVLIEIYGSIHKTHHGRLYDVMWHDMTGSHAFMRYAKKGNKKSGFQAAL